MANPQYDRTDIELLRLLQNDARMSNKELSAAVGLAPSSCHERLKRLRADGVLKGAHAEVDFAALGFQVEALLFVALEKHTRDVVDEFLRDMVAIPEVRSAFLVTGAHDMVVHVVVRDMAHLKNLALDRFTSRPGVTQIETSIIFQAAHRYELTPEVANG
jgi:DNA-binding Lrp family transcriptional regulator